MAKSTAVRWSWIIASAVAVGAGAMIMRSRGRDGDSRPLLTPATGPSQYTMSPAGGAPTVLPRPLPAETDGAVVPEPFARVLQQQLFAMGHYAGPVDGIWSPACVAAVAAFERAYRWTRPAASFSETAWTIEREYLRRAGALAVAS